MIDLSAAPEVALLTAVPARHQSHATIGQLAGHLRQLAGEPSRWRDLLRFDPRQPVQVPLEPPGPGCAAWLLVLPPGERRALPGESCGNRAGLRPGDVELACLVAGELAEHSAQAGGYRRRPLRQGRVRVRGMGGNATIVNTGREYSISLHAVLAGVPGYPRPDSRSVMLSRPLARPTAGSPVPGSVLGTPW